MRANSRGDLIGCVGGQALWVWLRHEAQPRLLLTPDGQQAIGGDGQWLTDDTAIALTDAAILAWDLASGTPVPRVFDTGGPNRLRAAEGTWLATIQAGVWQTRGEIAGTRYDGLPDWGIYDMARPGEDGAFVLQSHLTDEWRVCDRAGQMVWSFHGAAFVAISAGYVMSKAGPRVQLRRAADGAPVDVQLVGMEQWPGPCVTAPDGRLWVCYESDTLGVVLHPADDASRGYLLGTPCFSPVLHLDPDGRLMLAWATGEGEATVQLVRRDPIVLGEGMVPLVAPVRIPTLAPSGISWLDIDGHPQSRFVLAEPGKPSVADPRARGVFVEFQAGTPDESVRAAVIAAITECRPRGLPLMVDVEAKDADDVARVRGIASSLCTAAGVKFVPSIDLYPSPGEPSCVPSAALADMHWCLSRYGDCHVWLALYRGLHGDLVTYEHTEQQVLDCFGGVWPQLGGVRWASVFAFRRGVDAATGRVLDGIQSLPSFENVAAQAIRQAQGPDTWPLAPIAAPAPAPKPDPTPTPPPAPTPAPEAPAEPPWIDPRPGCPGVGYVLQGHVWGFAGSWQAAKEIYDRQIENAMAPVKAGLLPESAINGGSQ